MLFQIQIGRPAVFKWRPPYLPDPSNGVADPSITIQANGLSQTVQMSAGMTPATIDSITDAHRLRSAGFVAANLNGLTSDVGGQFWLNLDSGGQYPVRVSHFDEATNDFVLAAPLPRTVPAAASGQLHHNVWSATFNAFGGAAIASDVDRSGVWSIDWQTDADLSGNNAPGRFHTDRGLLRVVRSIFNTGLTSDELITFAPGLANTMPGGRDSWQPMIEAVDVIGFIEDRLPTDRFADMLLGTAFKTCHSYLTLAHIVDMGFAVGVNDSEVLRAQAADACDRALRRAAWIDVDDDGVIDAGELNIDSTKLTGLTKSSAVDTLAAFDAGKRKRYTLNDNDDR